MSTEQNTKKLPEFPETSIYLLLIFCVYVVSWYLQIGYRRPILGEIRFEFILALILSMVAVLKLPQIQLNHPLYKIVIIYFLLLIIHTFFSVDTEISKKILIDRVFKFSVMALFIIAFVRSPRALIFFIAAFLFACLKMGQEGLVGKISGGMIWESQGYMRLRGVTPMYGHPNSFSGMALGTLPFIYYYFPLANKYVRCLFIIQALLSFNIIIFTASRTGYVALLGAISYLLYNSKKKFKFIVFAIIAAFIATAFIPSDYYERFESIFTGEERSGQSTDSRIEIFRHSVEVFFRHPFGVGVAAFPVIRYEYFRERADTHNLYMEILTNIGVQGFIVFSLLIITMFRSLSSTRRSILNQIYILRNEKKLNKDYIDGNDLLSKHIWDLKFILATCNAVILFLTIRLALGLFGHDLYEIYWWFSIGLTCCVFNINRVLLNKTDKFT